MHRIQNLLEPLAEPLALIATVSVLHLFSPQIIELFGFLMGSVVDWALRERAYRRQPAEQREPERREFRSRAIWTAIGFAVGIILAYLINGLVKMNFGELGPYLYPAVGFVCVLNALLIIELLRGVGRLATGHNAQEAFAGLVINWARTRRPRTEGRGQDRGQGPGPGQGGGHD
jgi:hypothetical protein